MDIEVQSLSSYLSVDLQTPQTIEVIPNVPAINFGDILDFNDNQKNNGYLIMYNSTTMQYELVNPDTVLSLAATEPIQPGLPSDFENQLDIDLDNRIDLDAGTF